MTTRVLITGAAGRIARFLAPRLAQHHACVLTDVAPGPHIFPADLADYAAIRPLFEGIDTVLHFGANAQPTATWEQLLPNNIVGVRNVFEAAADARCRRVVFASSVHVVMGYPENQTVSAGSSPRPVNLYGASKAWGEALAHAYTRQTALSIICLRLGTVLAPEALRPRSAALNQVITHDDVVRLVQASVEAPATVRFAIVNGISANARKRLVAGETPADVAYIPEDDAHAIARSLPRLAGAAAGWLKRRMRLRREGGVP
jgi:nucleoside-diphosphate-sugar epimerase